MKRLILTLLSTAAAVTLAAQPDSLDYRGDYYFSKRSQQESLPVRPHHTVMLGNSLTERGAWAEYFPEAHVINRGIGGDCVAGMAARLDSIVAGRPRAIFLMAGVNDLIFSTIAPEALLRQYERLLDRIAAESPATQVFIQSPLPLDEARNEPYFTGKNARIEAFDRLLRRMAARRGLKFIDIRSRMLRDGKLPAEYTVDGIHLTPAGYAVWVEALRPYVTPAGARIGTVTCAGRGLAGVVVSDGDNCAATDSMHGICAGDITSGDHTFYTSYNEVMSATGIEFRNAMGNHDMKLWGRSHETSAAAFEAMYGPAYYSYNVGEVHYAVLNDNYYIGRDWYYIGYLEERQLAWLERDLSFGAPGTTVVVARQIPTPVAGKDEKTNKDSPAERALCNHRALHRLLEPYDAHIVSGHMHTTTNCPVREGLYEHNVAALSGAWWQGAICTDGTPAGYAVFEVDGGEVSWYYKSVGHPRSFQLKIYDSKDDEAFAGRIVANVWNCDPAWTVEMRADGGRPVWMERTTAVDPQARRLYADASKLDHKWITVTQSDHYYAAPLPAGTRRVEVTARDRFGNTYRAEKRINR